METINVEGKSFIEAEHKLEKNVELDESFAQVQTPIGFKGIELYPHQSTVVKAMIDLENTRVVKVKTAEFTDYTTEDAVIETSAMVLSEPFGSGKTFEILALILSQRTPKAFPEHENAIVMVEKEKKHQYGRRNVKNDFFKTEVIKKFTGSDALIKPTLIVVGSSVLVQWENAIKNFTDLRVFSIGNYHSLKKFQELYTQKKLKVYDIILLKNGTVTGNFLLPGESPEEGSNQNYRSLVTVVGKLTAGSCWARAVYDDFDTISMPARSGGINALSTVYVSATTKEAPTTKRVVNSYTNIEEAIASTITPLTDVLNDKILFSNFNIRNRKAYTEQSTSIPFIKKFRCVYDNPDDNYIRLLGAMGEDDANNIMEMLNGDAIGTAAEAMGIKTNSVADIFKRMLDKKYERYMHDQDVLEAIVITKEDIIPQLEPHPEGKRHTQGELDGIRGVIIKKTVPTVDKIKFHSYPLDQMMDEVHMEYSLSYEQNGLAIHRAIDNIKGGCCQVCQMPLGDSPAFIVRCCGLIVCDVCGIKGNNVGKRYDYRTKCETIMGSCANCKAPIYPKNDLIFVDRDINLNTLLEARGDETVEEIVEEVPEVVETEEEKGPEIKNPKLKALLSIINGKKPENTESLESKIKFLLEGRVDKPQPADIKKKILVFANFNETLHLIENFLTEQGIDYLRLGGTFREMNDTVNKFKNYGKVLLINSQQHCAGLNIQFGTDLVFFHKIIDENIEGQVAGRCQRIGRTHNLHIHYLLYRNEQALIR
jgi:SNF2 family DNA or RNA helicase